MVMCISKIVLCTQTFVRLATAIILTVCRVQYSYLLKLPSILFVHVIECTNDKLSISGSHLISQYYAKSRVKTVLVKHCDK